MATATDPRYLHSGYNNLGVPKAAASHRHDDDPVRRRRHGPREQETPGKRTQGQRDRDNAPSDSDSDDHSMIELDVSGYTSDQRNKSSRTLERTTNGIIERLRLSQEEKNAFRAGLRHMRMKHQHVYSSLASRNELALRLIVQVGGDVLAHDQQQPGIHRGGHGAIGATYLVSEQDAKVLADLANKELQRLHGRRTRDHSMPLIPHRDASMENQSGSLASSSRAPPVLPPQDDNPRRLMWSAVSREWLDAVHARQVLRAQEQLRAFAVQEGLPRPPDITHERAQLLASRADLRHMVYDTYRQQWRIGLQVQERASQIKESTTQEDTAYSYASLRSSRHAPIQNNQTGRGSTIRSSTANAEMTLTSEERQMYGAIVSSENFRNAFAEAATDPARTAVLQQAAIKKARELQARRAAASNTGEDPSESEDGEDESGEDDD